MEGHLKLRSYALETHISSFNLIRHANLWTKYVIQ